MKTVVSLRTFSKTLGAFILSFSCFALSAPFYDVKCENESDCPGWMAGLAHGGGVCSTFMVTDSIMATNLHCIPDELRNENLSCKGKIRVFFPKTSEYAATSVDCDTILYTSPPLLKNLLTPDFAFFKLAKPMTRPPLELSQSGMADMAEMTVYKVDPSQGGTGTIRKVLCTAVQNTLINPFFNTDKSPLVTLMPCHTIPGNSGSPILGSDGKVHGILSALTPNVTIVADPEVKAGMQKGGVTLGANFSCLNTFFLGRNQGDPADCKITVDDKTRQAMLQKISAKTMQDADAELNRRLKNSMVTLAIETKRSVDWKVKQSKPTAEEIEKNVLGTLELEPHCLIRPAGTKEVLETKLRRSEVTLPLSWTLYKVHMDHDGYYRPKTRIDEEVTPSGFVFTPLDFLKTAEIPVRIEKARSAGSTETPVVTRRYSVNICK